MPELGGGSNLSAADGIFAPISKDVGKEEMAMRDFPRRPTAATGERPQSDEFPEPWVPVHDGHHHDGWNGDGTDADSEETDAII